MPRHANETFPQYFGWSCRSRSRTIVVPFLLLNDFWVLLRYSRWFGCSTRITSSHVVVSPRLPLGTSLTPVPDSETVDKWNEISKQLANPPASQHQEHLSPTIRGRKWIQVLPETLTANSQSHTICVLFDI